MPPLDLVGLTRVMQRTEGRAAFVVGLIDGPVETSHPDLVSAHLRPLSPARKVSCRIADSAACAHGTMVAGILFARRGTGAPAICPGCTFVIRPIFHEQHPGRGSSATAPPEELAKAIVDTVNAGARVINLSSGLPRGAAVAGQDALSHALSFAAQRGVLVVVAAGNQSSVAGSCITQHPWVIPVASCDAGGLPSAHSNVSSSIGRQGLLAPGDHIRSLAPGYSFTTFSGTSAACPFVSGAIALLWSEHRHLTATQIRQAVLGVGARSSVVPPLLNAWEAWRRVAEIAKKGSEAA